MAPHLQLVPPTDQEPIGPLPDRPPSIEVPPTVVDPGQPISISAWFATPPLFSYLAPGEEVAVHDPGFNQPGSRLRSLGCNLYRYTIDTRGMRNGEGWWYFQNEATDAEDVRVKLGRFTVREAPQALLDRAWRPEEPKKTVVGLDSLAAPYEALAQVGAGSIKKPLLWLAAGVVIAVVLS